MNKAIAVDGLGDLRGAVGLYDRCIAIRERLVEQEGHGELAGDLARGHLQRAWSVLQLGEMTAEERNRAQAAFQLLVREAERTGRSDLNNVVDWAKKTLDM